MWIKRPRGRASTGRRTTPEPLLLARRQLVAGGLGIVGAAACWPAWLRHPAGAADGPPVRESSLAPNPPRARQDPRRRVIHGVELVDEYAWLRAPNWRAALDDPTLLSPDILDHLRAENAYAEGFFASLRDTRERIAAEMQADMDPRWLRPPQPFGPYLYEMRYGDGEQPLLARRPRGGLPTV